MRALHDVRLESRTFVRLPLHRPNGANGMGDIEGKGTGVGARMELRGREQHRWVKPRRSNGAYGKSDMEGKAAMEAARKLGRELVSNARQHMSQSAGSERVSIEGTDFRDRRQSREVAATEYGQRRSFNGANGMSDIEGKVTRGRSE